MTDPNSTQSVVRVVTEVIFALIASFALIENVLAFLVFVRHKDWLKKPHNQCILNLVIVDILTAISLFVSPKFVLEPDAYSVPTGYLAREIYSRIIWSHYIPFSLGITSMYTCLALALERWFAVVKPARYKRINGAVIMKYVIPLCWLAGFATEGLVVPRVAGVEATNTTSPVCKWTDGTSKTTSWTLAILMFFGHVVFPASIVIFCYSHIFISFRGRVRRPCSQINLTRCQTLNDNLLNNHRNVILKRVTIMTAVASLTLILGWLPNQVYFLLTMLGVVKTEANMPLLLVVGSLAFLNACINPVIYVFMDRNFREGFRKLLSLCSRKKLNEVPCFAVSNSS